MKYLKSLLITILILISNSCYASNGQEEKVYYAIEINGVVCGYTESSERTIQLEGKPYLSQKLDMYIMLSLFGSEFNTSMKISSILDPVTKKCFQLNGEISQGPINRKFDLKVESGKAIINSSLMGEPKNIELTPDVLIGGDEVFMNLKREFADNNKNEITYNILEAIDAEIQNSTYKKIGEEEIELAGKKYKTIVIEQHNNKTGVKIKYWLAPELGYFVMFHVLNRKVYLADQSVVDKIKVAAMDGSIMTKTNKSISDVQAITYMKLKVEIQPTGINLKPEDLNIPGQKFEGTIKDNLIKGTLEIKYNKYNGENAPTFPPHFSNDKAFMKYLLPSNSIQSDDQILIDQAKSITKDAGNSWEAARMLSKWVAEKIHYAIPGGGSARGAYDMKAGECGAHSMLLAAFCRAVGIPARVVYGGMYVPNMGGAFGQHAWNEIYMGEAGWIPVDATAFETDFIDAGHIRISEHIVASSSFNAKSIEILDYKLGDKFPEESKTPNEMFAAYLGEYKEPKSGKIFKVLEKEGNLSVDIPGQAVLPFNKPDENGRLYCKLSNRLFIEFGKSENDKVSHMIFHNLVAMQKQQDSLVVPDEIPADFKSYIGNYYFPAVNAVFRVEFVDNTLGVYDPTENKTIKLQLPDEKGGWLDEFNKNTIYFEKDTKGNVTAMNIDAATKFIKE